MFSAASPTPELENKPSLDLHGIGAPLPRSRLTAAQDNFEYVSSKRKVVRGAMIGDMAVLDPTIDHSATQRQHWRFVDDRSGAVSAEGYLIAESSFEYKLKLTPRTGEEPTKIVIAVEAKEFSESPAKKGIVATGSAGPFTSEATAAN